MPTAPTKAPIIVPAGPPSEPNATSSPNSSAPVSTASFIPVFTAFFVACFAIDLPTLPASFSAPSSKLDPSGGSSPCSNCVSGFATGGAGFASSNCSSGIS